MSNYAEEINRRMMNGEFGNPVNMDLVNAAWADILDSEVKNRGRKTTYNSISGLWAETSKNGKVMYSGRVQEDITIPSGCKILVLKREPEAGTKQPDAAVVYITYDE